ncbi:MAG: hypothetical protein RLZZ618_2163 [Pseudomonadota bacterium]|jgi:pimeloyl-ACP methyl ester carboxylesterase
MRIVLGFISVALILYGAVCATLFFSQRSLIYFPQPRSLGMPTRTLQVDGAELVISVRGRAGPKALIYFGGNAEDVSVNLPSFSAAFPDHALYLLHYRGYGGSSGRPSEAALHADAQALFDTVHRAHPDVAVVGRSLGSGVAVRLAAMRPVSRLVLVTPYDSVQEIAIRQFPFIPIRWLIQDKFESWRHAPSIRVPTLLLAAEFDEVIPRDSTERLHAGFAKGVASMQTLRGAGHNTVSDSAQYLGAMQESLK